MNDMTREQLEDYYREAEGWAEDRIDRDARSRRIAWIVAAVAGAVALIEAIAIVVMLPLKTVEPYTLLVDKQTGSVQALRPLERQAITPDAALTRSFLVQYVIARESFDIDVLKDNYRKVALWSAGEARSRYVNESQASNPLSPLATLPRRALVEVQVRSVSALNADTAMIRYSTVRSDPGAQPQPPQHWVAVVKYRFSGAEMSAEDRLTNPLGFQVLRYRRDAENLPEAPAPAAAAASAEVEAVAIPAARQ